MPEIAPILDFADQANWAAWLGANHDSSGGVWLRLAKKGAPSPSVSYAEALDAALCYGWIDAQKRPESETHWLQKFNPRAKKSIWSKINREKVVALIESGRMQAAGLREIERAQADGRWDAAYDSARTATVPPDLEAALKKNKKAAAFFETLDRQNRYAILWRLQTAKKPETRTKRLEKFVEMLKRGEKIHP